VSLILAVLVALAPLGIWLVLNAITPIYQEEMRTRLSRLPNALIRLAASRLPPNARADAADEWQAELAFMLSGTAGLPVTRLLRGTRYALGLLRVSRSIARELSASDQPAADRETPAASPVQEVTRFGIGALISQLANEFPNVRESKIRFLEAEGLIKPTRTLEGYRTFSASDVERLRFILRAQRDQYLPLRIIRDQLDNMIPPQQISRPGPGAR
jgi:hypothetical protein